MNHKNKPESINARIWKYAIQVFLVVFFFILTIFPLMRLIGSMDLETAQKFLKNRNFFTALKNSVISALVTTLVSVSLAYVLAYCTERIKVRHKRFLYSLFVLPMLIPSMAHGIGAILLLGNSGILTSILHLKTNIYGFNGIVYASVLYTLPTAYIMISGILHYQDGTPYEVAATLDIPGFEQFRKITLPYLRKPLISVFFTVFTLAFTDYGVPMMVGGRYVTLPVLMYQEVIGQLNFGKGIVCSLALLIPAIVAFVVDLHHHEYEQANFIKRPYLKNYSSGDKICANVFCWFVGLCILMPIGSFLLMAFASSYPSNLVFSFEHVMQTFHIGAAKYLMNSVVMAFGTAILGMTAAVTTAYFSARMQSKTSRVLHLLALSTATIPGIVLGLSYVLAFKNTFFYGTIFILILVNTMHFFASPYLMMYQSFLKLNHNLETVGDILSVSRIRIIKDVLLPMCRNTLLEMFSFFFVNCMVTISAVSFLVKSATTPFSLLIDQFETQRQLECAAVVSLIILVVNLLVKLVVQRLEKTK